MKREHSRARHNWREIVESQGLLYAVTPKDDGTNVPYWFESARYVFNSAEVEYLETVAEELHRMAVAAAIHVLDNPDLMRKFNLDPEWAPYMRASMGSMSLYGRFDLAYEDLSKGHAKMLEYNADTPTGVVEGAIAQWYWLEDVYPDKDQWNSLHERLVDRWTQLKALIGDSPIHFAHSREEKSGEEHMTVGYLRETAVQAGLNTYGIDIEDIGFDSETQRFVGLTLEPISTCFKLFPWEEMLHGEWGKNVINSTGQVTWIEPAWKALLSNKGLLAVMWELYPNHPNLLPAYFDDPRDMTEWIAKPLHGREGDGIKVHTYGHKEERSTEHYGEEGFVYQAWHELPDFDGNHPVLGAWIVGESSAGVGIRESDGPVTDYYARFVPHVIDGPRPSEKQIKEWLRE